MSSVLLASVSDVRIVQVNVSAAEILLVELGLSTRSFIFALQENECIASWAAIVHVDDDVSISYSEISEEVSDLSHTNRVWKSAHLKAFVPVILSHVIRKSHILWTSSVARATISI